MKQRKFLLMIIVIMGILLIPNCNYAVLQANPNTHGVKINTLGNWILNVRKMEALNQGMGLEEEINETTLKSNTESNKLDVHMIKSTEYGAIAILSASGYGNSQTIQSSDIKTTTGNKSGIYFNQGWEWTAGGGSKSSVKVSGVDDKYYDIYGDTYTSAKVGDALGSRVQNSTLLGCVGWHGATHEVWGGLESAFARGYSSIFSFYPFNPANGACAYSSRSVVVCGEGF